MFKIWADSKAIRENLTSGSNNAPTVAVEKDGTQEGCFFEVEILGPSKVCSDCSSWPQVWIETESEVQVRVPGESRSPTRS